MSLTKNVSLCSLVAIFAACSGGGSSAAPADKKTENPTPPPGQDPKKDEPAKLGGLWKVEREVPTTGHNVREVRYKGGRVSGRFFQNGSASWMETNSNGTYRFRELNRDDNSVYLRKEDGAQVQLDLWRKKVVVNRGDLYDITSASGPKTEHFLAVIVQKDETIRIADSSYRPGKLAGRSVTLQNERGESLAITLAQGDASFTATSDERGANGKREKRTLRGTRVTNPPQTGLAFADYLPLDAEYRFADGRRIVVSHNQGNAPAIQLQILGPAGDLQLSYGLEAQGDGFDLTGQLLAGGVAERFAAPMSLFSGAFAAGSRAQKTSPVVVYSGRTPTMAGITKVTVTTGRIGSVKTVYGDMPDVLAVSIVEEYAHSRLANRNDTRFGKRVKTLYLARGVGPIALGDIADPGAPLAPLTSARREGRSL